MKQRKELLNDLVNSYRKIIKRPATEKITKKEEKSK